MFDQTPTAKIIINVPFDPVAGALNWISVDVLHGSCKEVMFIESIEYR